MSTPYLRRAFTTSATTSGNVLLSSPDSTEPTSASQPDHAGVGCHRLNFRPTDPSGQKKMLVIPFGQSYNTQFRMWIELFHIFKQASGNGLLYIPTSTLAIDCTMSNARIPSTYGNPEMLNASDRMCSIIATAADVTAPTGETVVQNTVVGSGDPSNNQTASIVINTYEASYIRFAVDINGGTGTGSDNGNALFALL